MNKEPLRTWKYICDIKLVTPLRPGCAAALKEIYFLTSEEWAHLEDIFSYCGLELTSLRMHHLYKALPAHVW